MNDFESIVFYFPYRGVGGVSVLFLRLAEHLKRRHRVYVADYSDGYMARHVPGGVNLIPIDKGPLFPRNGVFVFQSFLPWRFPFLADVDPGARVFFWNLHPKNFNPELFNAAHDRAAMACIARLLNPLAAARRSKTRSILSYLLGKDALVFMDRENVRSTAALTGLEIREPRFLPVVLPRVEPAGRVNHPVPSKPLRCAWVGRIADFKWQILEHLIVRLREASTSVGAIRFSVIGGGEFKERVQLFAGGKATGTFSVEFLPDFSPEGLAAHLRSNVDILFAMGTSALEGARLGVPVFLLDYSYKPIAGSYRFRHLFEREDNCLAEEIAARHLETTSSLERSIAAILADYPGYSERCRQYCEEHFGLEAVAPAFLKYCRGTQATFGEMAALGFFDSDWIGKVLRSTAWTIRGHDRAAVVGFRNDC